MKWLQTHEDKVYMAVKLKWVNWRLIYSSVIGSTQRIQTKSSCWQDKIPKTNKTVILFWSEKISKRYTKAKRVKGINQTTHTLRSNMKQSRCKKHIEVNYRLHIDSVESWRQWIKIIARRNHGNRIESKRTRIGHCRRLATIWGPTDCFKYSK